jgi:predicted TIM-barrel fold metal-dependent hydrolase
MGNKYRLPAKGKPPAQPRLRKIAVEEHFDHPAVAGASGVSLKEVKAEARSKGLEPEWFALVRDRLSECGPKRLAVMDAAGIDVSLLSLTTPGVQGMVDAAQAVRAAREINDHVAQVIRKHPDRFAGLATLPLQDPKAAVRELERCVKRLKFVGAHTNGYNNTKDPERGEYLDEAKFLPFWEAAAALKVPVYLHPRTQMSRRIYEGHEELIGATWGFGVETATHALRLIFSGLFDRFPDLTVILGHMGETLPFFAWRVQRCFEYNPFGKKTRKRLQDYLCENFYFATSGCFDMQSLLCGLLTVGADRILFAADYPFEMVEDAARWLEQVPISENDRRKIAYGNAQRLFGLGV